MKPILMAPRMAIALRNTKIDAWPAEPIDQTKPYKWQTRRAVKPQPAAIPVFMDRIWNFQTSTGIWSDSHGWQRKCPYGRPGDHLYTKENYKYADWTEDGEPIVEYCDGERLLRVEDIDDYWSGKLCDIWSDLSNHNNYDIDGRAADRKWRPSIYMPRWASRTHLKLGGIRIERLRDISESDAISEGFESREEFFRYYAERNKKSPEANPWVWVLEFRRVL